MAAVPGERDTGREGWGVGESGGFAVAPSAQQGAEALGFTRTMGGGSEVKFNTPREYRRAPLWPHRRLRQGTISVRVTERGREGERERPTVSERVEGESDR